MSEKKYLTAKDIQTALGIAEKLIHRWIATGELRAVNIASTLRRPRWRIDPDDLTAFLQTRDNQHSETPQKKPALAGDGQEDNAHEL